jgi:opacity protein-like surface antigen
MKKVFFLFLLIFASFIVAEAQLTKAGGGLAYGTGVWFRDESIDLSHKTGNPAINFKAIYEISLPFHISPSVSIFMPRVTKEDFIEYSYKQSLSAFLFDINAHYVFNSLDRFEFYGLSGVNVTLLRMRFKDSFPDGNQASTSSESAIGLNLGAGTYMKMTEQLDVFAELKYILSKRDQFMLTAGVLLNLDWLKKNETKIF